MSTLGESWFVGTVAYTVIECTCIISMKRTFAGIALEQIWRIIIYAFKEIFSEEGNSKFCGALLGLLVALGAAFVVHAMGCAFSGPDARKEIILSALCVICLLPPILGLYLVNRILVAGTRVKPG